MLFMGNPQKLAASGGPPPRCLYLVGIHQLLLVFLGLLQVILSQVNQAALLYPAWLPLLLWSASGIA